MEHFFRPKNFSAVMLLLAGAAFCDVPNEDLVAYYPCSGNFENKSAISLEAAENHGATFAKDRFGNENSACYFDGEGTYLEIPDNDAFSIITAGALTVSVWMSPEVLTFKNAESGGYVHWMGKGMPNQHEWVFRMYNKDLTSGQENRPNRISAYAFNLKGGLGSGSYVQEETSPNEWIHIVARYNVADNTITIFKNGVQKDQDDLYDATYGVQVENGTAPIRLGTRSLWSFFQGRIDDLRIYSRALSQEEISALYEEQDPTSGNLGSSTSGELSSSSSSAQVNSSSSSVPNSATSSTSGISNSSSSEILSSTSAELPATSSSGNLGSSTSGSLQPETQRLWNPSQSTHKNSAPVKLYRVNGQSTSEESQPRNKMPLFRKDR